VGRPESAPESTVANSDFGPMVRRMASAMLHWLASPIEKTFVTRICGRR
jgi:hypothetical protein